MEVETEETKWWRGWRWQRMIFVAVVLSCLWLVEVADGDEVEGQVAQGRRRMLEQTEWEALVAIKQALIDERGVLESWNTSGGSGAEAGMCSGQWAGIKCAQGRVIALQLANKGLSGQLAAEIGQLVALRKLNFHTNAITGPVPDSISALPNLRGLYLFQNLLSGSIPDPLSSSPALQFLDLHSNNLSGAIPANLSVSARFLGLDLSSNSISGTIPASLASFPLLRSLRLSHNQLSGHLPNLFSSLQTIDLSDNHLNGSLPSLRNFSSLITINVSHNELTGSIPADVGQLPDLLVLDVSSNKLTGGIPAQLGNLTRLSSLDVSRNNFTGSLPSSLAKLTNLTAFNCSFNNLGGAVPIFAHTFNASSFEGNIGLCGYSPSVPCEAPSPAPTVHKPENQQSPGKKKRFSPLSLVFIIIGSAIVAFLLLCLLSLLFLCFRRKTEAGKAGFPGEKSSQSSRKEAESSGKLVQFEGAMGFAADDLLCATAEVLGKSTYGTVYKATLEDGNQVAVKRLREGIVKSQRDFETEVATLGGIGHPNLLALRAFYWGPKDEKLLIYDFMQGGSLAALLHARGPETPLTWQTRMNIAIGAARGLLYLHDHERIVHGNFTSSNILLDSHMNPRLSDFGLSRLMTTAANSNVIATAGALGYRAPELTRLRNATAKSDVYSFGIVLLELLTGKAPGEGSSTESGMDLPDWVASIVREEWTHELFDLELMKGTAPAEDELVNTLQVAMSCVRTPPQERPEMEEVVQQLEQIKPDLKQ